MDTGDSCSCEESEAMHDKMNKAILGAIAGVVVGVLIDKAYDAIRIARQAKI